MSIRVNSLDEIGNVVEQYRVENGDVFVSYVAFHPDFDKNGSMLFNLKEFDSTKIFNEEDLSE